MISCAFDVSGCILAQVATEQDVLQERISRCARACQTILEDGLKVTRVGTRRGVLRGRLGKHHIEQRVMKGELEGDGPVGGREPLARALRVIRGARREEALERFFAPGAPDDPESARQWFASPYWPVAFELAFHHPLLDVMFTEAATQNAAPGSYPRYFQAIFEDGLTRPGAARNPFLQHILLGRYLSQDAPGYVKGAGNHLALTLEQGSLLDVEGLETFDIEQGALL